MELKMYLAGGEERYINATLEEFTADYLDAYGNWKVGYIQLELNNLKEDPVTLIFTNQIVAIEEVKK